MYEVGGDLKKYTNDDHLFTICPDDSNKQKVKIAFAGRFDIAPGDILTIYEGIGTGGAIRERYNNNGTGFQFFPTCEDRLAVVTCPPNRTIPSICDINNSNSVAALYVVPAPTATCSYEPIIMSAVQIDTFGTGGAVLIDSVNNIANAVHAKTSLTSLTVNGDFFDANGNGFLDVGETVFLVMERYTISYDYMNIEPAGNRNCSYELSVAEIPPVCNDQVNISLDNRLCELRITPDMIIEGEGCDVGYDVHILSGANIGTNLLDFSYVDQTIQVEVVTPLGNYCRGYVLVEDKAAPIFSCPDTSIYCGISTNPYEVPGLFPSDGNDCTGIVDYAVVDIEEVGYGCGKIGVGVAPDTIGRIVRSWTATDGNGITSLPCIQRITLLKPKLIAEHIIWPTDTILYCQNIDNVLPATSGYPGIKVGTDTISIKETCLFGIEYNDQVFDTGCEGTQKIRRIWSVLDWCDVGSGFSVLQSQSPQLIKVIDTIAPIIEHFPTSLEYTSDHGKCNANVILPPIKVVDECNQSGANYRIVGPHKTLFNEGGVMNHVPFGITEFTYIAEDGCGNQTIQKISVTIKDKTAPTAIARELSVSLSSKTDLTWVYASSFDGGSHDNCGIGV